MPVKKRFRLSATKKVAKRIVPKMKRGLSPTLRRTRSGTDIVKGFHYAYANASAERESIEAMRPNKITALQKTDPTATVAAAAGGNPGTTGVLKVTIKEGRFIHFFAGVQEDEKWFLVKSFRVNGYDVVDGIPVNLSSFMQFLNREDRFGPLTGRVWNSNVDIEAEFLNIDGTAHLFHGINIHLTDNECKPGASKSRPAPGFYSFAHVARRVRLAGRKIRL